MNYEPLQIVYTFKYLGATLTKDGKSETKINIRMAIVTPALVS